MKPAARTRTAPSLWWRPEGTTRRGKMICPGSGLVRIASPDEPTFFLPILQPVKNAIPSRAAPVRKRSNKCEVWMPRVDDPDFQFWFYPHEIMDTLDQPLPDFRSSIREGFGSPTKSGSIDSVRRYRRGGTNRNIAGAGIEREGHGVAIGQQGEGGILRDLWLAEAIVGQGDPPVGGGDIGHLL